MLRSSCQTHHTHHLPACRLSSNFDTGACTAINNNNKSVQPTKPALDTATGGTVLDVYLYFSKTVPCP